MRKLLPMTRTKLWTGVIVSLVLATAVDGIANSGALSIKWTWGPVLPERRTAFGCCSTENAVITVGGSFWTSPDAGKPVKHWLPSVYRLILDGDKWTKLADYPEPIEYALVTSLEGRIYVIGGRNEDHLFSETYWIDADEPSARWQPGPNLPRPFSRLRGGSSNGVIYAVTDEYAVGDEGVRPNHPAAILAWDTSKSDRWIEIARLPDASVGFRAAAIADGKLYLFGGAELGSSQDLQLRDSVWVYDLSTGVCAARNSLPCAIRDASAVALSDRYILIAGGVEEAASGRDTSDGEPRIILSSRCWRYDCAEDRFAAVQPLPLAVADHGLAVMGDQVFVVGGEDSPYRTRTDLVQCANLRHLVDGAAQRAGSRARRVRTQSAVFSATGRIRDLYGFKEF